MARTKKTALTKFLFIYINNRFLLLHIVYISQILYITLYFFHFSTSYLRWKSLGTICCKPFWPPNITKPLILTEIHILTLYSFFIKNLTKSTLNKFKFYCKKWHCFPAIGPRVDLSEPVLLSHSPLCYLLLIDCNSGSWVLMGIVMNCKKAWIWSG